jgi:hypothetical protein
MRKGIEPWQRDFGRIHTPAMKNALIVMATAACNPDYSWQCGFALDDL